MPPNPKCKCHKQITFTPNQFQHERAGFKNTMNKILKGNEKAWNSFKPAVKTLAPDSPNILQSHEVKF